MTMAWSSSLYVGRVVHQRLQPKRHKLAYRVFSFLIDIDELGALDASMKRFSRNGFNLFSFHDADHGDGSGDLRGYVEGHLARAGVDLAGGRIALLCYPRILGYVFNPLSVYFCYRSDESLAAILYEVRNTFGEKHSYLIPVTDDDPAIVRQSCDKCFFVSPFMEMDMRYHFRIAPPGERISLGIRQTDERGAVLNAVFSGAKEELSDAALVKRFRSHPLMTLKIIGGIHWEALKLWLKGMKLLPRPPAPEAPVTIVERVPQLATESDHAR
ncbi:MAG: DUF1365 family protein [Pseudomonadota bacterium]